MKIESVVEEILGLPEGTETNIERVLLRNGRAVFITSCDVTTCGRIELLRNEILNLQNKMKEAREHLKTAAEKMTEGMPKKEMRRAYEVLNPARKGDRK